MKLSIPTLPQSILTDILLTITFVCFVFLGFAFIPKTVEPYRTIGYFKVSKNAWGITIYQDQKHAYYLFSPVNDYTASSYGNHQEELLLSSTVNEKASEMSITSVLKTITDALVFYTNPGKSLVQTFIHNTITYEAAIAENTVTVKRTIIDTPDLQPISGMTMTWSRDDIIIDENGMLYTEPKDQEINYLQTFFPLKKITYNTPDYRIETHATRIYIINPNVPGVLELSAQKTQKIYIDARRKQIDVEELFTNDPVKTTTVSISIHDTIPNNGVL